MMSEVYLAGPPDSQREVEQTVKTKTECWCRASGLAAGLCQARLIPNLKWGGSHCRIHPSAPSPNRVSSFEA
jgi:hypothetical protein